MPPKNKNRKSGGGRPRSSAVVDGLSTEDMNKDQLEEHVVRLREEQDREREERRFFQLERDRIQSWWEICRRDLDRLREELRRREQEKQEAEERHRVEISVYKQKLKHVLSEQRDAVSELKMAAAGAGAAALTRQQEEEEALRRERQHTAEDTRQEERHNDQLIQEVTLKHQVQLLELTQEYDRRLREVEVKGHERLQALVESEERRRRAEAAAAERRLRGGAAALTAAQQRALRRAEDYHTTVLNKVLTDQKLQQEEAADERKRLRRAEAELGAAQQEVTRLRAALSRAHRRLPDLQEQLLEFNRHKAELETSRARVKLQEAELRDRTIQQQLLLQAFAKVEQERDELLLKHSALTEALQQRSRLAQLQLHRRVGALTQGLHTREAQLLGAVGAVGGATEAGGGATGAGGGATGAGGAAHKLEETLQSKQSRVGELEEELARQRQEYEQLLQTCAGRLDTLGPTPQQLSL